MGTHSSGQLFQHLPTLSVNNFPLTSNLNLSSFSFKPFSLVLLLFTLVKSCLPSCSEAPFRSWKAALRSPCSLLFSRLNKPSSLSLSYESRSIPGILYVREEQR